MTTTAEPIHPGEHLAEVLEELGISQYRLAKAMACRINASFTAITADTA